MDIWNSIVLSGSEISIMTITSYINIVTDKTNAIGLLFELFSFVYRNFADSKNYILQKNQYFENY